MSPALLTAVDSTSHVHLIIGSGTLAGARCIKSLEVGAVPILIAPDNDNIHYTLAKNVEEHKLHWVRRSFEDDDVKTLGREEIDGVVDAVFVTSGGKSAQSTHISTLCRRLRIPIGVTTSGKGCKLASRIRREIAASIPSELGSAVDRLGTVRRRIWEEDHAADLSQDHDAEDEGAGQTAQFNKLVTPTDLEAAKARRMRWLAQVCEYWPLKRLAAITDADVEQLFATYTQGPSTGQDGHLINPATLDARAQKGHIILAGSGPGHPDLLTTATLKAIRSADIILADKLVPAGVLELVPRRTPVEIAKKFPGNAEQAQEEFLQLGLQAVKAGKTVLRLKQGDPYLYGRGAEEFDFFRKHGYIATVLPGITSSLSAPLFARIPVTHRAVSDQVLICTGTGRKGAAPSPPDYLPNQTVVFLMALHRLTALRDSLLEHKTAPWPVSTPCAVIERASCPDQRVIRSTLEHVTAAVEEEGSRPPGLLVVGLACEVLEKAPQKWVVEEGFTGLEELDSLGEGRKGLDALRDRLITPGLDESGDPMLSAKHVVAIR
ncbi:uroporphyrin-III C-methyltransferase [Oleoguttula sp. CCFEE 5521]